MEATQVPTAPEMGAGSRLVNVIFAPTKAFESIARNPGKSWLLPVALLLIVAWTVGAINAPRIDIDSAVRVQMAAIEKRSPGMSEEQKGQIESTVRKQIGFFTGPVGRTVAILVLLIPIFFVPAIYHGAAAAFGKAGKYMTVVAGYAWAQIPTAIYFALSGIIAFPRDKLDIMDLQNYRLVKSNVAAFLSTDSVGGGFRAILSNLDLFSIWGLVLCTIMLSKTTKFTTKGAFMVVGSVWGVWVLIQAGLGALQSAFS